MADVISPPGSPEFPQPSAVANLFKCFRGDHCVFEYRL